MDLADDPATAAVEKADFADRRKRKRNGGEEEEVEMRRMAEIVLVLSAMGTMRGGRNPTAPEKAMMAEARAMAVSICQELAPKDIVPKEAFGGIIEDLGLSRFKEPRLASRPPKQSILDRMEASQKRVAETKTFAAQASVDSIQRVQPVGENRGMPSHMQTSAGTFQHNSPTGHVSSASSTILCFQPTTGQVRAPGVSTGLPNSNMGRDSSSTSRVDIPHLGSDGRVNGPSQAPTVSTGFISKTTAPLQPRSVPSSNISTRNKPPEYSPAKFEGNLNVHVPPLKSLATNVQTQSSVFTQAVPGTLPSMHHPIQGTQYSHTAHHFEISKIVQKLLHPKPAEQPTWSPPSRDYMSKSITCQMCKLVIKEVENMFVCDACEKGFHSKCLQSNDQKLVSRGEWYCPRCVNVSGGKPFPPKYGRVTRNLVATNITSSRDGIQSPPDERAQAQDQDSCQQNIVADGEPDGRKDLQGDLSNISPEAKTMQTNKIQGSELPAAIKKEESPSSDKLTDKNPASSRPLENGPTQHVEKTEASLHEEKSKTEAKDCTSAYPSGFDASKDLHPSSSIHGTEGFGGGVSLEMKKDIDGLENHSEKSDGTKTDDGNLTCNFEQDDRDAERERQTETAGIGTELQDIAIHYVDWISDVHEVVEDKKFYQSCQINGVVYKLHDYALIGSTNKNLIPWKLQAMWEDSQTGLRWVDVNRCYFPADLPATVGHPSSPEGNEVYESNDESTFMAGSIEGPCIIVPAKKFGETEQIGDQQSDEGWPVFSCRWFYDKIKGVFRPVPS